jgi:quercetin dioxygenase-like cupin family protein
MNHPSFHELLEQARDAHQEFASLSGFCAFPDDIREVAVERRYLPCAEFMDNDATLRASEIHPFARAFLDASPHAHWRDTYAGTDIGQDFMDRFGCYCLIGPAGAYSSDQLLGFVVYMPPNLWYPWHQHPAEELYTVLAGEAEFLREGAKVETLGVGESAFHASNQPHAMETKDQSVLAYVTWRNHFETKPILTEREIEQ